LIPAALFLLGLGIIAFGLFSPSKPAKTPEAIAPAAATPDTGMPAPSAVAAPAPSDETPAPQPADALAPSGDAAPAPQPVITPPAADPPKETPASTPAAAAAPAQPSKMAVFPSAISPAHASENPIKARLKTCFDQFKANEATNSNGGLKWVQKGGGYLSECEKRLKG
jgi:hypothetical protein